MSPEDKAFVWKSRVHANDLDIQKIVNNAAYMQYLHLARVQQFQLLGIDWEQWHNRGYNLVLAHADMHFKAPLVADDEFAVVSTVSRKGKLKIVFHQEIFRTSDNKCVLSSVNTVVCVDIKTGKPCFVEAKI